MNTNKKAIFIMDMPDNCFECLLRYHEGDISLGDFKFQRLFRCRLEPEDVEDIYLQDIMNKRQDWCPLKEMPEKMGFDYLINGTYEKGWNDCIDEICNK